MKGRRNTGKKSGGGAPSWIVTFADLMTLLLTFFVLLLSFSQVDVKKYQVIAASMAQSFGLSQFTDPVLLPDLAPIAPPVPPSPQPQPSATQNTVDGASDPSAVSPAPQRQDGMSVPELAGLQAADELATNLIQRLEEEIAEELVTVTYDEDGVLLRFTERASFAPGSAELKYYMRPVLAKVVEELAVCDGEILVVGHTDDRPIISTRFRSNWDLSAARAVSVVHQLVLDQRVDASKVRAVGQAETQPLVANRDRESRALNRRVEIHMRDPSCRF